MSRVARIPVPIAKGVDASVSAGEITVKGPLGTLKQRLSANVKVTVADGAVSCVALDETREANAMSGTLRSLVAGMVLGVTKGFEKRLSLVGVGYRAQAAGDRLKSRLVSSTAFICASAAPHQGIVGAWLRRPRSCTGAARAGCVP